MSDTLLRLGLTALIIAIGLAAFWGWNRFQLRRLSGRKSGALLGLEARPANTAAVLYFRTPECTVCTTAQRPALDRLSAELGKGVHVIEVDAAAQPAVADYWGVLSVPTTFVIDATGQPRAINHGLTSKEKLQRQLEATRDAAVAVETTRRGVSELADNPAAPDFAPTSDGESEWSIRHESYPRTH